VCSDRDVEEVCDAEVWPIFPKCVVTAVYPVLHDTRGLTHPAGDGHSIGRVSGVHLGDLSRSGGGRPFYGGGTRGFGDTRGGSATRG